jgi:hypothetical protein
MLLPVADGLFGESHSRGLEQLPRERSGEQQLNDHSTVRAKFDPRDNNNDHPN